MHEGVATVDAWLDHHFPGEHRTYLPCEGSRPHLWRVLPGRNGPGFRLAVHEDLLPWAGMLASRLEAVSLGTSALAPGDWVVISTRGIERRS